jgi:hypothetical protein
MKYKGQALAKIEKLEHQIRALEVGINRGNSLDEIGATIQNIKNVTESLRETISIEQDEWID